MKLDLISMEISAFRDFAEDQQVDFPQKQVCAIMGENLDDDGSNGSGKSSLAFSIPVNIYGPKILDVPAADLSNNLLNAKTRIVGHYRLNDKDLVIDRELGGKLKFDYDGSGWVDGKVEDVQAKINTLMGISPKQLLMLTNKPQENSEHFLTMKDAEKKDFLGEFFNIENYDKAKLSIDEELKDSEKAVNDILLMFESIKSKLAIFNEALINKKKELEEHEKVSVEDIKNELLRQQADIQNLKESLINGSYLADYQQKTQEHVSTRINNEEQLIEVNHNLSNLENQLTELKISLSAKLEIPSDLVESKNNAETSISVLEKRISKNTTNLWEIDKIKADLHKLDSSLRFATVCEMCGQPVKGEDHKEKISKEIESRKTTLDELLKEVETMEMDRAILIHLKEERDFAVNKINEFVINNRKEALDAKLIELLSKKSSATKLKDSLEISLSQAKLAIETIEKEAIYKVKSQIQIKTTEIHMLETQVLVYEDRLSQLRLEAEKLAFSIEKVLAEKIELEESLKKAEDSRKVLKTCSNILSRQGFLGYIFDNILEELNSEINKNIQYVPNIRQYRFQFSPDKYVKSTGALSKTITHTLRKGDREINFKTLSGGEKLGITFAVDEALEEVVSRRLGVKLGWKILDEQFTWIDQNSKEPILEFYKAKSANKTYMIIEHSSEFNAAMDSRIIVTKKNGIATITRQ